MIKSELITECLQCNRKLDTLHENQKCCSTKCAGLYKRRRILKICDECGYEFECSKTKSTKKYCTQACYFAVKQKKNTVKICEHCGQSFDCPSHRSSKKYCTRACYLLAKKKNNIIKKCKHCGEEFLTYKHAEHNFCSRICYNQQPTPKLPNGPKRIPNPCEQCGKLIQRRQRDSKYCSKECQYEGMRIPRISRTCIHCKKPYTVKHQEKDSKYCSKKCYNEYLRAQSNEIILRSGHVAVRESGTSKYRPKHVVVMEAHLGRALYPNEIVHHINYDKQDNRIENLAVMTKEEHGFAHGTIRHMTKEFLELGLIIFDRKDCVYRTTLGV